MAHLSDLQLARVAKSAGFQGEGLVDAIAVALAESDGVTDAVNTTGNHPPSRDRGLWQINDYWHPEVTDAEAFDAARNASAAYGISSRGTKWTQWATWNSGSYRQFLARARAAVAALGGGTTPYTLHRLLRVGVTGTDVELAQGKVGATPDGDFGPKTDAAVKAWQRGHRLAVDGIIGQHTARSFGWSWAG